MTPSQQAKSVGLKGLTQVVDMHGLKPNGQPILNISTLSNWQTSKPELFETVIIGAAYRSGCLAIVNKESK